jgi:hypothetical protein
MYIWVPAYVSRVPPLKSIMLEQPKSVILQRPLESIKMFSGFRSLWTIGCSRLWRYYNALTTSLMYITTLSSVNFSHCCSRSYRQPPSANYRIRLIYSSSSYDSYSLMMFSWSIYFINSISNSICRRIFWSFNRYLLIRFRANNSPVSVFFTLKTSA